MEGGLHRAVVVELAGKLGLKNEPQINIEARHENKNDSWGFHKTSLIFKNSEFLLKRNPVGV